ncbi:MAG: methyltransferase domain-containing protein [Proteobacteria bacterium]|nr:methyltransferase domain-containing protein [Pseudomonadota bacterium]
MTDQMNTEQLALWRSPFGRDYTDRNDHEKPERIEVWRQILEHLDAKRVLEVGCNAGWNLAYLETLGVPTSELYGIEPQAYAAAKARERGFNVLQGTAFDLPFRDGWFDLAFTSGVMIHIAPKDLGVAMDEIYRVARRWIVAIEYDHPVETEIAYRGNAGALWKRDHGGAWRTRYPQLSLVARFEVGAAQGYDDCTVHIFEKP